MKKILVIIPAYNEEKSIGRVLEGVMSSFPEADVLVIDDGSTDNTSKEARKEGVMVVSLPSNMGLGVAIQTGLMFAQERHYEIVIRLDADGQHRPSELRGLLVPIEKGEADIVVGSRFLNTNKPTTAIKPEENEYVPSPARKVGIRFFSSLLGFLLGDVVTDPTSGLQAMNRNAISFFAREYPPDYPEIEAHILAYKAGLIVKEVPSKTFKRLEGRSSITFLKSIYVFSEAFTSCIIGMLRGVMR